MTTLSFLVTVLQRQDIEQVLQLVYAFLFGLAFLLGRKVGHRLWMVCIIGVSGAAYMALKMAWLLRISGNSIWRAAVTCTLERAKVMPRVAVMLILKSLGAPALVLCCAWIAAGAAPLYINFVARRFFVMTQLEAPAFL